jgi:hypothetical protein
MRQVLFSNDFIRDYQSLPEAIRKKIDDARVTQGYRLTFRVDGEVITMRRAGTHDLLRTP